MSFWKGFFGMFILLPLVLGGIFLVNYLGDTFGAFAAVLGTITMLSVVAGLAAYEGMGEQ